jgi:hypothetical protein
MQRVIRYCLIPLAIIPSLTIAHIGHDDGSHLSLVGYYLIMLSILVVSALATYGNFKNTSSDQSMSEILQSQPAAKPINKTNIAMGQNSLNEEAKS